MRWHCAALLIASIAAAAPAAPQKLTGRVLDAQGAPAAGAEVAAYFDMVQADPDLTQLRPGPKAASGPDGGYTFEVSPPKGCFRGFVVARKDNGAPSWTEFYVGSRRPKGSKDIVLEDSASISGTIADQAGQPVAGAEVTADLWLPKSQPGLRKIPGSPPLDWLRTKTDAQGHFTISNLPKSATAKLHVKAPGKATALQAKPGKPEGAYAAGDMDIHIALAPEARIQGTVVDEDTQKPLAGLRVLVGGNPRNDPQACVTDAGGAFEAAGLPAGDYTLSLLAVPDQLPSAVAKAVTVKDIQGGELRKGIVLPASPGGLLEVLVTNEKKEPVSGANVAVAQKRGTNFLQQSTAVAGKDGLAAFRLLPGDYQVVHIDNDLYYGQFYDRQDTLDIQKGKTLRVEMAVAEKPHASGVVLDPQGKPVAGAAVTVMPFSGDAGTITNTEGKFEVRWHPWGGGNDISACLLVRKPEADLAAILPLDDQEKSDGLKIALAPGITVTGTVVDPDNKPISEANVSAILNRDRYGSSIEDDAGATGQDGKYTIRALPAGENYRVTVGADKFGRNQSPVDLGAAKDRVVTLSPLVLKHADLTVTGIVVDGDDKPVSGANVYVWGNEQNSQGGSVVSDKDGKFTLKNVCDADATIQAQKNTDEGAQQSGSVNFSPDMKEVKVVMGERSQPQAQGAANLHASGVVLDPKGQPVAGATVQAMPFGNASRKTDKDGKFKLSWQRWNGQDAQSYLLVREPKSGLAAVFPIEDETKQDDLKLMLAPGLTVTGAVTDPENKPILKAEIHVTLQLGRYGSRLQQEPIRIGQDGRYVIRALPADQNYQVSAQAAGFGQKQSPADLTAARDRTLEMAPLVLKPAPLTVAGVVVDADDKPVSGVQINAWGPDQNVQPATSGREGKFTLKNVCDGELRIQAWKQSGSQYLQGSISYTADMKEARIVLGQNAQGGRPATPRSKSLIGKPLPDLKPFGLDLPRDGKPILLCFWAQDQRPSRQRMNELLALAQSPEGKLLSIVTVHAEPVEREALSKWTDKPVVPVGMIEKDAAKVRAGWGVQSLPWLILAAPDGTVLAEGFQPAEWQEIWKAKSGK